MSLNLRFVSQPDNSQGSLLLLHGLGDSGDGLAPLARILQLPLAVAVVDAPQRKITPYHGMQLRAWYDVRETTQASQRAVIADVEHSYQQLLQLCSELPQPIYLLGFSQGAAMALYTGLRQPKLFKRIMALSGYYPGPEAELSELAASAAPLLIQHGIYDDAVPLAWGYQAVQALQQGGAKVEYQEYQSRHEIRPQQLSAIRAWLAPLMHMETSA